MNMKLTKDDKRVLVEALKNEYNRLNDLLENLSIDDYGHDLGYDISILENVMIKLDIMI